MLRSRIEPKSSVSSPIQYPCLRQSNKYEGLVVLFIRVTTGIVVYAAGPYRLGHYDEDWAPAPAWKRFDGAVLLHDSNL